MPAYLIEPTDVLFFRDGVPMSAGQGHGSGCRLPFPSTLHEALRASLLKHTGREVTSASTRGRDHRMIATKDFQSLATVGPLPWHEKRGLLLPVPMDVALGRDFTGAPPKLRRLALLPHSASGPACLPVSVTPPDKHSQLHGWWTIDQFSRYLVGDEGDAAACEPLPTERLWQPEHRIGLAIDPERSVAADGQLFAGTYLRMDKSTRFCFEARLPGTKTSVAAESAALESLDWLLIGGDRRLARLRRESSDPFAQLRAVPESPTSTAGPVLLKWILVTPAIFANGSMPGWCKDTRKDRSGGRLPDGRVCFDLPGKAALVSSCLGRPQTVTGWDMLENRAKPTQLAVPAGSVFHFLCEDVATAAALVGRLHWQPRSDHYGEKGCGYGLCSFDVQLHPSSPNLQQLADCTFKA